MVRVPAYIAAQTVGAIVGAAAIIGVLGMAASDAGLGVATYTGEVSAVQAFFAEFVGTFILVFTVFGVIHRKASAGFAGVAIGLVVFAAIIPVAPTTGASINPARTFGPMLVQQLAGGSVAWSQLPVYLAAEFLAGVLAALAYVAISRTRADATPAAARVRRRRSSHHRSLRSHAMKKLINDPADVIGEALRGMAAAHPELRIDHTNRIIYRGDAPVPGKVGLISGGGSGHEPLHGGFVGRGMLDAACAGEVFTSPVPDQMLEATKNVDGGAGVLHIVKNYTGDVMNFEMAAELADAEGITVESVVVDDDVAVQDSTYTAGRRGVGATVLVEKLAGAAADQGRSLPDVADVARRVNGNGAQHGRRVDLVHGARRRASDV